MLERDLGPFEGGVTIKNTCRFGLRAEIRLIRPEEMSFHEYEDYVLKCRKSCYDCTFERNYTCGKMNSFGIARAESFATKVVDELISYEAPCVIKIVEVIKTVT